MNWTVYLLQVNLVLASCWVLYYAAFKQLTFFQWNRIYLLGSLALSFLLPLVKLQLTHPLEAAADITGIDWTYVDHLVTQKVSVPSVQGKVTSGTLFLVLYLLVSLSLFIVAVYRNWRLFSLASKASLVSDGRVKIYVQDGDGDSFTLFRRIYMNRTTYEQRAVSVLKHEMVHASQLHSLDLLLMEFVVIILWFNPFVFLLRRHIRDNHEYLADEGASDRRTSLVEYLGCLKAETLRQYSPAIVSNFTCSTIKKRIIMLTTKRSNTNYKWRYLGVLPLVALMITLFHTSPGLSVAGTSANPDDFTLFSASETGFKPDLFPLPEAYREKITWGFNLNAIHPISRKPTAHEGVDIAAPAGTPVYATAEGTVKKADELDGWGMLIILEHERGFSTRYAHLDGFEVKAGDPADYY